VGGVLPGLHRTGRTGIASSFEMCSLAFKGKRSPDTRNMTPETAFLLGFYADRLFLISCFRPVHGEFILTSKANLIKMLS
jgi:hypothetical protein